MTFFQNFSIIVIVMENKSVRITITPVIYSGRREEGGGGGGERKRKMS